MATCSAPAAVRRPVQRSWRTPVPMASAALASAWSQMVRFKGPSVLPHLTRRDRRSQARIPAPAGPVSRCNRMHSFRAGYPESYALVLAGSSPRFDIASRRRANRGRRSPHSPPPKNSQQKPPPPHNKPPPPPQKNPPLHASTTSDPAESYRRGRERHVTRVSAARAGRCASMERSIAITAAPATPIPVRQRLPVVSVTETRQAPPPGRRTPARTPARASKRRSR